MKGLKRFIEMFFNNKNVVNTKDVKFIFVLLVLIINVSLVSIPNFVGKMQGVKSISNIKGIEAVFDDLYEMELDCHIDREAMLSCNNFTEFTTSDYLIRYDETPDLESIKESTVYFSDEYVAIVYVDEAEMAFGLSGNYSKLIDFDFEVIKTNDYGNLTKSEYYTDTTDVFLSNIYYSQIGNDFLLIYLSQMSQILIYTLILSGMFMFVNLGTTTVNLKFRDSVKIVVFAMSGPAFITALLGIFISAWSSILFLIVYAMRLMFLYYGINPKPLKNDTNVSKMAEK